MCVIRAGAVGPRTELAVFLVTITTDLHRYRRPPGAEFSEIDRNDRTRTRSVTDSFPEQIASPDGAQTYGLPQHCGGHNPVWTGNGEPIALATGGRMLNTARRT